MRTALIKIGNSKGIRIPQEIIEKAGLTDSLNLTVENGSIVIKSVVKIREGWAEAAAECGSDNSGRMEEWDCTVNDFDGDLNTLPVGYWARRLRESPQYNGCTVGTCRISTADW